MEVTELAHYKAKCNVLAALLSEAIDRQSQLEAALQQALDVSQED